VLRKILFTVFILPAFFSQAQSITYNQYNAVLAEINPAYIVQLERDYVSTIGRVQWPAYQYGATMASFAFNKSFNHSSLGLTAHQLKYNHNSFQRQRLGLQYAYSVVFLDDFFLDFGLNLSLQQQQIFTGFYDDFAPKREVNTFQAEKSKAKTIGSDFGFILHPFDRVTKWYAGFAVRNIFLKKLPGDYSLEQGPIYSAHTMNSMPLTRRINLYGYLQVEYHGKIKNNDQTMAKPFTLLMLQGNIAIREQFSFGAGYKYFTGRYGSMNYRINYTTNRFKKTAKNSTAPYHRLTIGLSYDVKPYIQNDQVRAFSAYEIFLKYRINYKTKN